MRIRSLVLAAALAAAALGPTPSGPGRPRPAAPPPAKPAVSDPPPKTSPTDDSVPSSLDIAPWHLHAFATGPCTDVVKVSLLAKNGSDMRMLGNAADLAGLVASWRSEDDVYEFFRIVELYGLGECLTGSRHLVEIRPGSVATPRVRRLRATEGGFEVEREFKIKWGSQEVNGGRLRVTLLPRSYRVEVVDTK
ncbi:MAG: hypothetical protein IT452_22435 [Planctomycetia bacterium]|nr:hypothetical protein [Planctomycetia bacterium]